MTIPIIIAICSLLLMAYLFDITSTITKIPSVILLILMGWIMSQLVDYFSVQVPFMGILLPLFGTIGLILIVLEGALELELDRSKIKVIAKSFLIAFSSIMVMAFGMAFLLYYFLGTDFILSLINAIPFCIISSAIAIPSASSLKQHNREFVIYESSLSDIIGVLFFNFITLNEHFDFDSFGHFGIEIIMILLVSFAATMGLSFLLHKIKHHVKFAPIILLTILIYSISKMYHLPGLIFILFFGLFLGNLDELKGIPWIKRLYPEELNREAMKFKELVAEAAFLIRALFFILFGYLLDIEELLNIDSLLWSILIVGSIYSIRFVLLLIFRMPQIPLLFIAPRGLITILLFFNIAPEFRIEIVNNSLVIQVIIISALMMMLGSFLRKNQKEEVIEESKADGVEQTPM